MAALLADHFDGAHREVFYADLAGKTHVVLVRGDADRIVGFSTLALVPPAGTLPWTLYSGDTIVASEARVSAALSRGWIETALSLRDTHRIDRLVWLLICSSVRTYRFLPLFFEAFAPHPVLPTPPAMRDELEQLARARYGGGFDAATGTVTLRHPQVVKRDRGSRPLAHDDLERHFRALNPGADQGDELVCHCEIRIGNLTAAGRRMLSPERRSTQ
jgi:hypothetical protein